MAVPATVVRDERLERAEACLEQWGAERQRMTEALGLPRMSTIAVMIERVKVFDKAEGRRHRPKRGRARQCGNCGHVFIGDRCTGCSTPPPVMTARGTETRSFKREAIALSSVVAIVDKLVAELPNGQKQAVTRAYLYGQPDRIAARELRIPRYEFTYRREMALERIAARLVDFGTVAL